MFHSSLPRLLLSSVVFLYSVFPCLSHVLLYSCIKKELFFLLAVLQSVCLSVFVRLAIFLAVWLQVEKWGHSVGKLTGWIPDGWSSAPSRHGDLTGGVTHRCLYPTFCLCVSPCVTSLFSSLPSCEVVISEVGEVFSFSLSSIFWFLFSSKKPFILLLARLWHFKVCMQKNRMPVTNTAPPLPNYPCCHHHKSCTLNAQTTVSLQLCGINDAFGSAWNSILLNALVYLACLHFRPSIG